MARVDIGLGVVTLMSMSLYNDCATCQICVQRLQVSQFCGRSSWIHLVFEISSCSHCCGKQSPAFVPASLLCYGAGRHCSCERALCRCMWLAHASDWAVVLVCNTCMFFKNCYWSVAECKDLTIKKFSLCFSILYTWASANTSLYASGFGWCSNWPVALSPIDTADVGWSRLHPGCQHNTRGIFNVPASS